MLSWSGFARSMSPPSRSPALIGVVATFECKLLAPRRLRLGPSSLIREHTDLDLGIDDGEARVHVVLHTDDAVASQTLTRLKAPNGFRAEGLSGEGLRAAYAENSCRLSVFTGVAMLIDSLGCSKPAQTSTAHHSLECPTLTYVAFANRGSRTECSPSMSSIGR